MKTPMNEPITMFKKQFNFLSIADYSVAPEAPVRNFEQQLSDKNSSALR